MVDMLIVCNTLACSFFVSSFHFQSPAILLKTNIANILNMIVQIAINVSRVNAHPLKPLMGMNVCA